MLFTLVFAIMGMLGLTAAGYIHNVTVLDRFADEMVACATLYGKTKGEELDSRFDSLVASTGLNPSIEYVVDEYYNYGDKTVQYGEAITVVLSIDLVVIGYGDTYITSDTVRKSTGQSFEYWKG